MYNEALGLDPPCDTCNKPELWEENEEAWEVFTWVSGQRDVSMAGVGEIRIEAIEAACRILGVEDPAEILEKVLICSSVARELSEEKK